jgi:5-formyltetrahydrofolate cyclo-ligase
MTDPVKQAIRNKMRAARAELDPDCVLEKSGAIAAGLTVMLGEMAGTVCGAYLAKPDEVQTDGFLSAWLANGGRVCVPKFRSDIQLYEMVWLDDLNKTATGRHGVREPLSDSKAWFYEVDFILVPGVAFDLNGGRLGHGLGYYDRLLANVAAPKIGLAFDFQIVDALPLSEQDVRMDGIITESRSVWLDQD